MQRLTFAAPINLQAAGKSRRFAIQAYAGGELRISGFDLPVIVDLQGLDTSTAIPILIDHAATVDATLGQTDRIVNDGRSLSLAGPLTGVSPLSQQVLAQAAAGHVWQASIGAAVIDQERIAPGAVVSVNGQQFRGPVIVARRSVLKETSVLPMGADSSTSVNLAAKLAARSGDGSMSFEEWLKGLGVDAASLTPEGKAMLSQQYDAQQTPPAGDAAAHALLNLRATQAADIVRIREIERVAAGFPHVQAAAISGGWTPEVAELHALRLQARQNSPSNRAPAGNGMSRDMLTASLMIRAGHETVAVKSFGAQTCEVARSARLTNLVDVCAAALQMAGHDRHQYRSNDEMIRAAFSTSSLPTILSDTVGRTLISAYEETASDWGLFCFKGQAPDFKTQTGVRPAAIAGLVEIGPGGKIKSGSIAEEDTYTWSVDTFARMLSVDRKTIVNDDLGFIAQLSPMLGVAAGRSLNDLIWSTIMGGQTAAFFASANSNLDEAGSDLDVASLGAAVAAMRSQRDSQGFDIGIAPAVLVVPPTLELTARNLLNSAELLGPTTAQTPSGNPVKGIVPNLVVEPRLENSTRFTGTSAASWYVFGVPQTRPVTVGFLDGKTTPTVEVADADFDTLGVQMRTYFDYGVALSDPKAAYKATGAAA